jgi:hypothetical protein
MREDQVLPNEILFAIFKQIPPTTVHHCLFVCKVWAFAAAQEYYKEIID